MRYFYLVNAWAQFVLLKYEWLSQFKQNGNIHISWLTRIYLIVRCYWCLYPFHLFMYICIECIDRTYGYDCVNNCSSHCLGDSSCNKQTGHCDRGCNAGYTNSYCSKGTLSSTSLIFWSIQMIPFCKKTVLDSCR